MYELRILHLTDPSQCGQTVHGPASHGKPVTLRGACGYGNAVEAAPFSSLITAAASSLYNSGKACGTCFQVKCTSSKVCSGNPVRVVITDECPGCDSQSLLFDLSGTSFGTMATSGEADQLRNVGIEQIQYRRVECNYPGVSVAFRVDPGSNANYFATAVEYEDGDGVAGVELKQAADTAARGCPCNSRGELFGRGGKQNYSTVDMTSPIFSSAVATWYGDPNGAGSDGGACGYRLDVEKPPFSAMISAGNANLFQSGIVIVTITDECSCDSENVHFDLSGKAFGALAKRGQAEKLRAAGTSLVPCDYPDTALALVLDSGSNPYYFACVVKYVKGDGELSSVELQTANSKEDEWRPMQHSWGQLGKLTWLPGQNRHSPSGWSLGGPRKSLWQKA
ncbi:UNVERIFIED_CONTAM: putative expansin-B2 [Sesamum calycinum]|uniref:Expansin-B2 n=1 Tax=Sesamum calycinum TaxID=2727403 RepID=A0AAW2SYT0_9LAMI